MRKNVGRGRRGRGKDEGGKEEWTDRQKNRTGREGKRLDRQMNNEMES